MEEAKNNAARRIGTDYQESLQRERLLDKRMAETKAEYDRANSHFAGYEQIKREADDDRTMYAEMLRKVRESSINAAFQNHNIRVAADSRGCRRLPRRICQSIWRSPCSSASCWRWRRHGSDSTSPGGPETLALASSSGFVARDHQAAIQVGNARPRWGKGSAHGEPTPAKPLSPAAR